MSFRVLGLDPQPFRHLFGLSDADLAARRMQRFVAEEGSRAPDRIEIRDLLPGETAILLNYQHQPADTPYRASHAIFVREGAEQALDVVDAVPLAIRTRPISLRAFAASGEMLAAELVDGNVVEPAIERLLAHDRVDYLHGHYATRGCYAARVERA